MAKKGVVKEEEPIPRKKRIVKEVPKLRASSKNGVSK